MVVTVLFLESCPGRVFQPSLHDVLLDMLRCVWVIGHRALRDTVLGQHSFVSWFFTCVGRKHTFQTHGVRAQPRVCFVFQPPANSDARVPSNLCPAFEEIGSGIGCVSAGEDVCEVFPCRDLNMSSSCDM